MTESKTHPDVNSREEYYTMEGTELTAVPISKLNRLVLMLTEGAGSLKSFDAPTGF